MANRHITADQFRMRQLQLLDACEDLDLDALLVVANGSCFGISGRSQGFMAFVCGWDSFDSPSVLVLRRDKPAELVVVHHRMMMMSQQTMPEVKVSWIDQDLLGSGLQRVLSDANSFPHRIGICGWEDMIAGSWRNIEDALSGAEFVDIKSRVTSLRISDSKAKLAQQRNAAGICDGMFNCLAHTPVVGRLSYQIKAELECFAKQSGAEFVQHWLSVGSPPDYPRYFPPENCQVPQSGDLLIYGMQILVDGVWGHAVRTFCVGPVRDRHRAVQTKIIEFQKSVMLLMKTGSAIAAMVGQAFQQAEMVHQAIGNMKVEMLRLGHGLGYSYAEPRISDPFPRSFYNLGDESVNDASIRFEEGMVFEIHPIFFYPDGVGGVGDMIEITSDEPRYMTNFPREIYQLSV